MDRGSAELQVNGSVFPTFAVRRVLNCMLNLHVRLTLVLLSLSFGNQQALVGPVSHSLQVIVTTDLRFGTSKRKAGQGRLSCWNIGRMECWNNGIRFLFRIGDCGIENSKSTTRNPKFVFRLSSNFLSAFWFLLRQPSLSWD